MRLCACVSVCEGRGKGGGGCNLAAYVAEQGGVVGIGTDDLDRGQGVVGKRGSYLHAFAAREVSARTFASREVFASICSERYLDAFAAREMFGICAHLLRGVSGTSECVFVCAYMLEVLHDLPSESLVYPYARSSVQV